MDNKSDFVTPLNGLELDAERDEAERDDAADDTFALATGSAYTYDEARGFARSKSSAVGGRLVQKGSPRGPAV
jgi:hypothetical protein